MKKSNLKKYKKTRFENHVSKAVTALDFFYFAIRGGSRKKIAKKIIPSVPIRRNVYTRASMIL